MRCSGLKHWVSGLFSAETFDRIGAGGFEGVVADGEEGDKEGAAAGGAEAVPREGCTVFVLLQPLVQAPDGKGNGDDTGEEDEGDEVFCEYLPEMGDGGAEDFTDTDLFCPLFHPVRGEPEEAEAGDEDGQAREEAGQAGDTFFVGKFLCIVVVDKSIFKRRSGVVSTEYLFDLRQRYSHRHSR